MAEHPVRLYQCAAAFLSLLTHSSTAEGCDAHGKLKQPQEGRWKHEYNLISDTGCYMLNRHADQVQIRSGESYRPHTQTIGLR